MYFSSTESPQSFLMEKNRYRKWYDPSSDEDFFLQVGSDGTMLQISICEDEYDKRISIIKTKPSNQFNSEFFLKHKEVCSKKDFETALNETKQMLK